MRRVDWEPVEQMMTRLSIPEPNSGCHIWQGKIGTGGYAYVSYREKTGKRLHRKAATVALELAGRPRPERLEVSHTCGNPVCVNVDHLLWESHSDNLKRRKPFTRYKDNLCKRGHELPPIEDRNKNGSCPICYADYQANWKEKNKQYEVNYREANKDRINANRRARRARVRSGDRYAK